MTAQLLFQSDATGAEGRLLGDKIAEAWFSVKDFGAVGDGTTDDTAAIQAAVDAATAAGGGRVYFPAGTYKTTGSVDVDNARRCHLFGDGKNLSIIARDNVDGPVIRLTEASSPTQDNGYYWAWEGLSFRFDPAAGSSDIHAVGVSFELGLGAVGYGYVNFIWRDINVNGCHVAISNDAGAGDAPNVWGFTWDGIVIADFASRALYFTNLIANQASPPPLIAEGGFPNCHIVSMYIQARSGITYTDDPFYCDGLDSWTMDCVEWNGGTFDCNALFNFIGSRGLRIGTLRLETFTFLEPPPVPPDPRIAAIIFSQAAYTVVENISVTYGTVENRVIAAVLRLGGETLGTILSIQTIGISGAGLMVPVLESTEGNIVYLGQTTPSSPSSGSWSGGGGLGVGGGYSNPRLEIAPNGIRLKSSLLVGSTKVVGARETGFGAMTGTATKTTVGTYAAPTISASYVAAEVQGIADGLQATARRLKAVDDALRTHGLID